MRIHLQKPFWALAVGLALVVAVTSSRAGGQKEGPSNAAGIRKVLDEKITVDFNSQNVNDALDHLRQKTKLNIIVDNVVVMDFMMGGQVGIKMGIAWPGMPGMGGMGAVGGGAPGMNIPGQVTLKADRAKLSSVMENVVRQIEKNFNRNNLTYVVLRDCVLITTDEIGCFRQMQQRVNVDVRQVSLAEALATLADDTGMNLVIDPRQTDKARSKVTLKLNNVTLDTAVRLLTDQADLGPARVGGVLYVTAEARAEKLRKESMTNGAMNDPTGGMGIGGGGMGAGVFGGMGGMGVPGIIINQAMPVPAPAVVPLPPPPPLAPPGADKKEPAKLDKKTDNAK